MPPLGHKTMKFHGCKEPQSPVPTSPHEETKTQASGGALSLVTRSARVQAGVDVGARVLSVAPWSNEWETRHVLAR